MHWPGASADPAGPPPARRRLARHIAPRSRRPGSGCGNRTARPRRHARRHRVEPIEHHQAEPVRPANPCSTRPCSRTSGTYCTAARRRRGPRGGDGEVGLAAALGPDSSETRLARGHCAQAGGHLGRADEGFETEVGCRAQRQRQLRRQAHAPDPPGSVPGSVSARRPRRLRPRGFALRLIGGGSPAGGDGPSGGCSPAYSRLAVYS